MFGGFDPSGDPDRSFFERRRWQSLLAAVGLVGGSLGWAWYWASLEKPVEVEEEIVDAEIQNFEMEEEPEEVVEEEPPPPEPPSSDPTPTKSKPQKQPEIQQPTNADPTPTEGPVNTEGSTGGGGGNDQRSKGESGKKPPPPEPEKPVEKPKKKQTDDLGRPDDVPGSIPDEATPPKKVGGDPIEYPEELRKRNVTGKVKVKLTIYKDGTVKGAKILAKENSVDPAEDPELFELANKLFIKALTKALPTWKYSPCEYQNKPITVYLTVTVPFQLD